MRTVSAAHTAAWKAQAKTGDQRPVVRATIQKANLQQWDYDTFKAFGGDADGNRHRTGHFTSIIFGDPSYVREIRNIKTVTWQRSVDQDVATCTLTLLNSDISPIGNQEEAAHADDFDLPGWFTYNRGEQTISANRWGYTTETGWQDVFVPDRLVRTYEGYGSDENVSPAEDPNLYQSGTWLIDKVTYTDSGDIVLEMRDVGRLLLDQIVFPPVIPYAEYPLEWEPIHNAQVPARDCKGGSWGIPEGTASSSNDYYIGQGLTDPPYDYYVSSNGAVAGHKAKDALVVREQTYWWSTGQTTAKSMVWWQVDLDDPTALGAIRINPHGGPYRCYISVKTKTRGWVGRKKIPYEVTTEGIDIEANIPFVKSVWVDKGFPEEHALPRKYANVEAVRLTFTRLNDTRVSENYPFRAGLDVVRLYTGAYDDLHFEKGTLMKSVGNFSDYTQIVKWVCAWGGFYWPPPSTSQDFQRLDADTYQTISQGSPDYVLPKGRVWGTFMSSGTTTHDNAKLTVDLFDKKPLMDVINYVRDVLGFIFFIDETGGVVWRLPNLGLNVNAPKQGNYLSPGHLEPRSRSRTATTVVIDEEETLLEYSTTLSSANTRERIFVANVTGKIGVVIKGFRPTFQGRGFRRVAGWTDQNFATKRECRIMADMVAARQMFDYRRGKVTMPGYAAVQIDDQVRIFERVTNETFFHYVLGISSTLDMEQGVWEYVMDTHWLGEDPSSAWVVDSTVLDSVTQAYLNELD